MYVYNVCARYPQRSEEASDPLEPELQNVSDHGSTKKDPGSSATALNWVFFPVLPPPTFFLKEFESSNVLKTSI